MAWALVGEDNWGVTARMAVDFRRPVEVGADPRGRVDNAARGDGSSTPRDDIVDATSGAELTTATGVYVAASPDRKRDLQERYAFAPERRRRTGRVG